MACSLELGELLGLGSRHSNLQHVESNGLGKWSTLTDNNNVTLRNTEGWRNVDGNVLVSLLVSVVFLDEVKVVSSDDDGSVHFGGDDSTGQNLTSDGDVTDEWTLLVNVRTLDGGLWGLESQTNVLHPSLGLSVTLSLWVGEDVWLLYVNMMFFARCFLSSEYSNMTVTSMMPLHFRTKQYIASINNKHIQISRCHIPFGKLSRIERSTQ